MPENLLIPTNHALFLFPVTSMRRKPARTERTLEILAACLPLIPLHKLDDLFFPHTTLASHSSPSHSSSSSPSSSTCHVFLTANTSDSVFLEFLPEAYLMPIIAKAVSSSLAKYRNINIQNSNYFMNLTTT